MSAKKTKKPAAKSVKLIGRRRQVTFIIAVFLWLLLSGFGYVWCRMQVVHLGYQLSKAHRLHSRLLNDNTKLHLELARLTAPERVELIALQQLGLKHPDKNQIVVLP